MPVPKKRTTKSRQKKRRSQIFLKKLNLVYKDERSGKWFWYSHRHVFSSEEEKDLYLKHSEQLIPGLYRILHSLRAEIVSPRDLGFDKGDEVILDKLEEDALQHIETGYPELSDKIEKCWEIWKEVASIIESVPPVLENLVWEEIPLRKSKLVTLGEALSKIISLPIETIAKAIYKSEAAKLMELRETLVDILKDIYGELNLLILQVKSRREPLLGECPHCPRIAVRIEPVTINKEKSTED